MSPDSQEKNLLRSQAAPESEKSGPPDDRLLAFLGLCGVLSAMFLIVATVLGGALREGYDPVRQSISELYETGAPNAHWLMILFTAYHALVIPLAVGLHMGLPHSRFDWVGPLLLGLAGLFGIPLGAYARCDPGCFGATTFPGQLHGILVLVTVTLIFTGMFAVWCRLRHFAEWRRYAWYTITTVIIGVAFGAGMTPFIQSQYAGLLERVSVAIILQWYVIMGIHLVAISQKRGLRTRNTFDAA